MLASILQDHQRSKTESRWSRTQARKGNALAGIDEFGAGGILFLWTDGSTQ